MNNTKIYDVENNTLYIKTPLFSKEFSCVSLATASIGDGDGLSVPYTDIKAVWEGRTRHFHVWDGLALVYMPAYAEKELIKLKSEHVTLECITLHAFTDVNDTLVTKKEQNIFAKGLEFKNYGDIFFLTDRTDDSAIVIISETPDYIDTEITVRGLTVNIKNGGCGAAIGFCRTGECERLCREYYRHARKPKPLIAMSNTWGDCNGFSRVCQDFVIKEIDAAEKMGVDIVQIDDGWQTGSTADTTRRDELGRRVFHGDFWDLSKEKFPDIKKVTEYAAARNIKIGLWFAPDSHENFALLERDIGVLKKAYEEWGVRFFKLDMFWISNEMERERFLLLLKKIYDFGPDVAVQLDITRNLRLNYLCGRQYGTTFVENRYTKTANSFPHRVLRNLWTISRYIPAAKLQLELVNPDLNKESYAKNDPFAPSLYDMDYLFASVMLTNPLFWQEMQFLSDERRRQLERIVPVWKSVRNELCDADVEPIGEIPGGRSLTGFCIKIEGKTKYLLLFREACDRKKITVPLEIKESDVKILASNGKCGVSLKNGKLAAAFSSMRSYVFVEIL